jgi:putative redox protein
MRPFLTVPDIVSYDEITRIVELSGALDDSQRQRLLEIADKCPVHRTLISEIKIRTRLAE